MTIKDRLQNVDRRTLPERVFDLIVAGVIHPQSGMKWKDAPKAKKAARRRVQASRRRNR